MAFMFYGFASVVIFIISRMKNTSPGPAFRFMTFPAALHIGASLVWTDGWTSMWNYVALLPTATVFRTIYTLIALPFLVRAFGVFIITFTDRPVSIQRDDAEWSAKYDFIALFVVCLYLSQAWYISVIRSALASV